MACNIHDCLHFLHNLVKVSPIVFTEGFSSYVATKSGRVTDMPQGGFYVNKGLCESFLRVRSSMNKQKLNQNVPNFTILGPIRTIIKVAIFKTGF